MSNDFENIVYREVNLKGFDSTRKILKSSEVDVTGHVKIEIEEEGHEGVKVILKKDEFDNIKQIKFVCSCGDTKSIYLDYSDE